MHNNQHEVEILDFPFSKEEVSLPSNPDLTYRYGPSRTQIAPYLILLALVAVLSAILGSLLSNSSLMTLISFSLLLIGGGAIYFFRTRRLPKIEEILLLRLGPQELLLPVYRNREVHLLSISMVEVALCHPRYPLGITPAVPDTTRWTALELFLKSGSQILIRKSWFISSGDFLQFVDAFVKRKTHLSVKVHPFNG